MDLIIILYLSLPVCHKTSMFEISHHVEPPPPLIAQNRSEFLVKVSLRPSGDPVLVPSALAVTKLPSADTRSTSTI